MSSAASVILGKKRLEAAVLRRADEDAVKPDGNRASGGAFCPTSGRS
jgi:hypothetical protein